MARRSSFLTIMVRESARMQRQAEAAANRELRERVRQQREHERQRVQLNKQQHQQYVEHRETEAAETNRDFRQRMDALKTRRQTERLR